MSRLRRRHVRRASAENAGRLLFLRRSSYQPCICVRDASGAESSTDEMDTSGNSVASNWKWVLLKDLTAANFILYRDKIAEGVKKLQEEVRNNSVPEYAHTKIIYKPSPDERSFLRQLFNNHLTDEEKQRYIIEFSHTIIGSGTCPNCFDITSTKKKCIHYECPGMCDMCYDKIDESCPLGKKPQSLACPICQETKKADELCREKICKDCGHYVCWVCLGKSYGMGKPITKCPLCRKSWFPGPRVTPQIQAEARGGAGDDIPYFMNPLDIPPPEGVDG